jgi:hypothetical protein
MSQPFATTATSTRAPAAPAAPDLDRVPAGRADRAREARRSRLWTVIEALAYAGAVVDPTGILAVERLRRAQEEEEARHGR